MRQGSIFRYYLILNMIPYYKKKYPDIMLVKTYNFSKKEYELLVDNKIFHISNDPADPSANPVLEIHRCILDVLEEKGYNKKTAYLQWVFASAANYAKAWEDIENAIITHKASSFDEAFEKIFYGDDE